MHKFYGYFHPSYRTVKGHFVNPIVTLFKLRLTPGGVIWQTDLLFDFVRMFHPKRRQTVVTCYTIVSYIVATSDSDAYLGNNNQTLCAHFISSPLCQTSVSAKSCIIFVFNTYVNFVLLNILHFSLNKQT